MAVVLRVVSSVLLMLGVFLSCGLLFLLPRPASGNEGAIALGTILVAFVGVVYTFHWFHESFWPALAVAAVGLSEVAWGMSEPVPAEPMTGLAGGLLYMFYLFTIGGGGALVLGGLLSLAAGRMATNAEGAKNTSKGRA